MMQMILTAIPMMTDNAGYNFETPIITTVLSACMHIYVATGVLLYPRPRNIGRFLHSNVRFQHLSQTCVQQLM